MNDVIGQKIASNLQAIANVLINMQATLERIAKQQEENAKANKPAK
jgi:hypothetical protein